MTSTTTPGSHAPRTTTRRAATTGLAVSAAGALVLNVAPFMNFVDPDGTADPRTGYETDSLVPWMGYLAIGMVVAMAYAAKRARRGQHRGLTLASMGTALAAALWFVAFSLNPMGGLERGDDLAPQIGVFVAILGSALWAIGSGLLAKEIEGDDEDDRVTAAGTR